MAKIAKTTAQVKSRQTKLSKKSNEELIEIILRKDKTEKTLNNRIIDLKEEVNKLSNEAEKSVKALNNTMVSYDALVSSNTNKLSRISELEVNLETTKADYVKLEVAYNRLKNIVIIAGICVLISVIALILC